MIENAMGPLAAQFAIVGTADQRGVLPRNGRLIAVAVQRPGLDLPLIQLAPMEHVMKRVQVMIALRTHGPDCFFEFGRRHRRLIAATLSCFLLKADRVHRRTSMPSKPTSQPDASTTLRASEFSSRMGLELLM